MEKLALLKNMQRYVLYTARVACGLCGRKEYNIIIH